MDPSFFLLQAQNGDVFAPRIVTPGGKFLCPKCEAKVSFCEECGFILSKHCSKCGAQIAVGSSGLRSEVGKRQEGQLLIEDDPPVILGSKWQGQDLLNVGGRLLCSRRLVQHFQIHELGPSAFSTVYFRTDGMNVTQRRLLADVEAAELR